MIRRCEEADFDQIWTVINDGAEAYRGIIPEDRWHEPYMTREELRNELANGVAFWGYEQNGTLQAVMGMQNVQDVTLIRHAYVRTRVRRCGIGGLLLDHLKASTQRPLLVGTWADAAWAIRFYEKHGFQVVEAGEKNQLLRKYWDVPTRQIETSVVLCQ
ncbi:GNAT family N-acetyltransferase [Terriglobus albidus]|uniref:GNAT family N-acetyltransferase n=1 Tax=Terriglobus albidus TaxID=1592106 RepID=A0A5B9EDH7_9BACT|nr:GNAT family N-acetyltransferase [Terriglobus albidus]QEE30253.1 GNAT family N-acetyltransferase [Terriglobus albidus]